MIKTFATDTSPEIEAYLTEVFSPEDSILEEIRQRSDREGLPSIQVGSMDGLHLEVITRAIGAKKAVEIGTLGGYSGTCILRGMGSGGKLHTFEFEPLHARVARESFTKAGFSDKQAQIIVGPALQTLPSIESEGPFDLVFCDADKESYPGYLDWAARNLKVGGVILGDNTLGWGMITQNKFDDPEDEKSVRGLQAFNKAVARGGRFKATLLPTGEGLVMAVKIR